MYLQNFSNVIMNTFDAEENSSILNNSDAKWYKDALLSHQRDKSSIKNVSKFMIPLIVPCTNDFSFIFRIYRILQVLTWKIFLNERSWVWESEKLN